MGLPHSPKACTVTGDTCGSSNSSAPACCTNDTCKIPPDCGGPSPPAPVYTCQAPSPPPPGCRTEGQSCTRDDNCCQDDCHEIHCALGLCTKLVPPTAMPSMPPTQAGVVTVQQSDWAAHDFTINNSTQYLIATVDNSCQQIPVVMKSKSLFCHGPYLKADFNILQKEWTAGKGSCKAQGYDHGPTDSSANVTAQTDMYTCHFTRWDFDHPLPLDQRRSQCYKKQ